MSKTKAAPKPWTPFQEMDTVSNRVVSGLPVRATGIDRILKNSRYQVMIRYERFPEPFGRGAWLSIKRLDQGVIRDWRDLQRIKNECLGREWEAVEIFPAESRMVDAANQFHLWAFETYRLPFGFTERLVRQPGPEHDILGAKQRPFEDDVDETPLIPERRPIVKFSGTRPIRLVD